MRSQSNPESWLVHEVSTRGSASKAVTLSGLERAVEEAENRLSNNLIETYIIYKLNESGSWTEVPLDTVNEMLNASN